MKRYSGLIFMLVVVGMTCVATCKRRDSERASAPDCMDIADAGCVDMHEDYNGHYYYGAGGAVIYYYRYSPAQVKLRKARAREQIRVGGYGGGGKSVRTGSHGSRTKRGRYPSGGKR